MSNQSSQPAPATQAKRWYMKWWIWLIAAAVVVGGVNVVLDPSGSEAPTGGSQSTSIGPGEQIASEAPSQASPLDLEAFLTESGVAFESATLSGRKAVVYVPTGTTNEQAQQIASDSMLYICSHAAEAGDSSRAANRVEVSDSVSIYSPGYDVADHPSGFATEEVCED